jgi:hypothetical protein
MEKIKGNTIKLIWILFLLILVFLFIFNANLFTGKVVYNGLVSSDKIADVEFGQKSNTLLVFLGVMTFVLISVTIYMRFKY